SALPRLLTVLAIAVAVAGCNAEAEQVREPGEQSSDAPVTTSQDSLAADSLVVGDSARGQSPPFGRQLPPGAVHSRLDSTEVVRALYVNRWAAQSRNRMRSLIQMVDSTVINAFVIDMKDEFGLNYVSEDSTIRRNAGLSGSVPRLGQLLDTLRMHNILPIARI